MQIKVNNQLVNSFKGARVKDVVLQYSRETYREVIRGQKVVRDHQGVRLGLSGRLADHSELTIAEI